jgi:uncharacterized membrane protein
MPNLKMKTHKVFFVFVLFLVCFFTSAVLPPLQSPDERDHIKRAYLLTRGQIILEAPQGISGGAIDSGLAAYLDAHIRHQSKPERKFSSDEIEVANNIRWTGIKQFSFAPGTGFYFPLIYAPQAAGLALGESLGISISDSYSLARLFALFAASLLLLAALLIYTPSLVVLALLVIPMSIFQMSSASLDGVATAVSILAISAFMRIAADRSNASPWVLSLLSICVLVAASSRIHLLPLVLLVFATPFYTNNKKGFVAGVLVSLLLITWVAIAMKETSRAVAGGSTLDSVEYYFAHPLILGKVFLATWSYAEHQRFYLQSFFGILGWLDARFAEHVYSYIYLLFFSVVLFSVSLKDMVIEWRARALLICCAASSVFTIFFALLVTWNTYPAEIITGVQGRYFLIPALLVAYALSPASKTQLNRYRGIGVFLLGALFLFSVKATTELLLTRYYIAEDQPEQIKFTLKPGPALAKDEPMKLRMDHRQKTDPQSLAGVGILIGTYARKNPGTARLTLRADDGNTTEILFGLTDLRDNQYRFFPLDRQRYTSGEITYVTGGGVSLWEAHQEETGSVSSCLVYEYATGVKSFTKGCPRRP